MNRLFLVVLICGSAFFACSSQDETHSIQIPLNTLEGLEFVNVEGTIIEHDNKTGLQVAATENAFKEGAAGTLVVLPEIIFENGIITLEVSGEPAPEASEAARGFVGLAFRINPEDHGQYECIYLRPKNGRAENQVQRNHSVQYVSHPEFPWYKLREEHPGVYETYVDLEPGVWTEMKIEVQGSSARLYVHGADQPTLLVNDLKRGESEGTIGLWLHRSTLARYRNLQIVPETSS